MQFTPEQLRAIDIRRLGHDACIVAGPGSGKTTVLVERYSQLVASGVDPADILAITFTEKAAANMRERLSCQFADRPETLRKLEHAQVSTIHAFCTRLLKEYATAAGVDPDFTVLDEQLGAIEQANALRETLDALYVESAAAMAELLAATNGADLEKLIPPIYDAMRAAGMRPADLRNTPVPANVSLEQILASGERYVRGFPASLNAAQRKAHDNAASWLVQVRACRTPGTLLTHLLNTKAFTLQVTNSAKDDIRLMRENAKDYGAKLLDEIFAPQRELLIRIFERFDGEYRARKTALAALDFNDLEFFAVRLLEENPDVRRQINRAFKQVMIDEFQDTSAQQSTLVDLVRGTDRFYAVGDLNQSIYSFRHASPKVFNEYLEVVKGKSGHYEELVENWRSREAILLATQFFLNGATGIVQRDLHAARDLPARDEPAVEVLVFEHNEDSGSGDEDENDAFDLEAQWVVGRIIELRDMLQLGPESRPAKLSDFAILVRNTGVLKPYLEALTRAGIDYNLNRRDGFFETPEARDLLRLLCMIENPRDEVSTLTVLRSRFAGISDEGLLRLKLQDKNLGAALDRTDEIDWNDEDRVRISRFVALFNGWRAASSHIPADRLVLRALDETGTVWSPASRRGANIEKFLGIVRSYPHLTLSELTAHLKVMRTVNPREADAPIDEERDAVQIMSTHAAKGLEFPVVILASINKGINSDKEGLNFTREYGLGVRWALPDTDAEPGRIYLENRKENKLTEEAETNRLLYVALTRAEEHLILSWTQNAGKKPQNWAGTIAAAMGGPLPSVPGEASILTRAWNGKNFDIRFFSSTVPPPAYRAAEWNERGTDLEILEPPVLSEQFETETTATALSLFAACPRKFYLSSYLGWSGAAAHGGSRKGRPTKSGGAAETGTEVHQLLAGLQPANPGLEALSLARVFESSAIGKRSYKAGRRETEWDFVCALEKLIVRGTIDLWFEDRGGFVIVDYKTDDVPAGGIEPRARDYFVQLAVYAMALERATGKAVNEAWLHFLRPEVAVAVPVEEYTSGFAKLAQAFTDAQERLDFPLHPGSHCRRCEFFRGACPVEESDVPQ